MRMLRSLEWMLLLFTCLLWRAAHGAFVQRPAIHRFSRISIVPLRASSKDCIDRYREEQRHSALIEALVQPKNDGLLQIELLGRTDLPTSANNTVPCLVLGSSDSSSCLTVPITEQQLKLLSFAYKNQPISKSLCLTLNPLLVNRDGGLFDELPWSEWTVDPQKRNRDAASQQVDAKFHLGKRDAYNRFMGKDWKGRSVSLGNMALRLKYLLLEDYDDSSENDDESFILAKRVLELQIRELQMELAEWNYQVAVARNDPDKLKELSKGQDECQDRLTQAEAAARECMMQKDEPLRDSLDRIAALTTRDGENAAPYRGAMGYAPLLDTRQDVDTSVLPYTSPYDLLKEIIGDQLYGEVIGTILENTSLLDGTLVLGGAVILRRKTPKKTLSINGETLSVDDEEEDFGNMVKGGETILVECDADEAIGMALACQVPIRVEQSIFGRSSMDMEQIPQEESGNVYDSLPIYEPVDKDLSLLVEGQARNATNREETSPLFIPKTTNSLFDSMFESSGASSSSSGRSMFPTDNPIQSLDEYDSLSNADKARTLTTMSNFQGKLPRPRVLRQWNDKSDTPNPLDQLLLPLVDESVRRKYLMRDAELRQDKDALEQLQSEKSRRQVAKEKAEAAREAGSDDVADWWDKEADLLESLRADVTQDEGSYSRFLDKDEWYERDRLARQKRIKKSSFGSLLDGIE